MSTYPHPLIAPVGRPFLANVLVDVCLPPDARPRAAVADKASATTTVPAPL
ncbi:MAG TPA: hypothetical protein VLR71_07140 [Casimicrobiaceae bacterium]|nr:hypothetical protein [Casimicrobiaceae bacterium]